MVFLEILKYTLPSVIVFLTAYFILKQAFGNQLRQLKEELGNQLVKENLKIITPIRLQAYERLVLFLERISPSNLIIRQNQANLNVFQFQTRLIQAIRDEFEHNLSQQLYISSKSWMMLIQAKEDIVSQINTAASKLNSDESASKLGQLIIQNEQNSKNKSLRNAIDFLKKEMELKLGAKE